MPSNPPSNTFISNQIQHALHEIVVVDDGSSDDTWSKLSSMRDKYAELAVKNDSDNGFGNAIIKGINKAAFRGDHDGR